MSMEKFIMLAGKAAQESVPQVDVAGNVAAALAQVRRETVYAQERALVWIAAVGSAAAIPVAVLAFAAYQAMADPFLWISETILWVAQ